MAYPDHLLASDEKVVKHLHPHWITLVVPIVALIVVVALAAVGISLLPDNDAQNWLQLGILVLAVLLIIAFSFVPFLRWKTTHYVITTHRVMFRTGVLNRNGKDIALPRITDVAYTQTLWDRIVGAGTLTVESAGEGPPQLLTNIPHSDAIQQLINHLIEEDEDRRSRDAAQHYRSASDGNTTPQPAPDLSREETRRIPPT